MTRFLIVRHGQTDWNAGGRFQGRADPSLSERGREQAVEAARALGSFAGTLASSGLRRAVQTAETFAAELGLGQVTVETDLNEIDVGEWTGLTRDEIAHGWPEDYALWRERILPGYPGGETRVQHWERIISGLERLAAANPDGDVLVVAHGGVLGSIERRLDSLTDQGYPHLTGRWFRLDGTLEAGDRVELLDGGGPGG